MPKSYHILLTTFGSYGDIHPYMAIARALVGQGHRATIGTSLSYAEKITSAGIGFAPIRPDLPQGAGSDAMLRRVMHPRTGTTAVIREVMLSQIGDSYSDTLCASEGCDAIVSHVLTYASPVVAEQRGLPWVFTALQPIVFFSAMDPSVPPASPWAMALRCLGPAFYRRVMRLGMAGVESWAAPIVALRREAGLPAARHNPITFGQFSPHLNLALFSGEFARPASDWPQHTVQTGFSFWDDYDSTQHRCSDALTKFLDSGPPPVVFTLGTAAVRNPGRFYRDSVAAAKRLGTRAVLLTGDSTGNEIGLELTPDIAAFDYAPYARIFGRASAIVHQGGIGTTAQALRSGHVQTIMPFAFDQFDNAERCRRLGVSRTLSRARYRATTAARAIRKLSDDADARQLASAIGERVSQERGAELAAELIVSLLR